MTATQQDTGKVWILRYSHRHGDDLTAFATCDLAYDALAEIAREWWDDITWHDDVPSTADGLADELVIEIYFDHREDEFWSVEHLDIRQDTRGIVTATGPDGG